MYDICIIGGGPSGMTAAIEAKSCERNLRICVLEKNSLLGKKIYATGNGKCNLSNINCPNPLNVYKFFDSIGIFTRTDDAGRMYPGSEQAADVVLALQNALDHMGVDVMTSITIQKVVKGTDQFEIQLSDGRMLYSKKLLIATGGKAGPQYGNLGDGYTFAKSFGHTVSRTYPVLSPLECTGDFDALKGIRAKGRVSLLQHDRIVATEDGEIQFMEDGLSGICVFNLSRFVRLNANKSMTEAFDEYAVSVDFVPNLHQSDLETYLNKKATIDGCVNGQLLLTIVHKGIANDILRKAEISPDAAASILTQSEMVNIAGLLKNWRCGISGVKGWKKAQCTGGGVPLQEVDGDTFESKIIKGLYFAGELLDYDGPSGGFNLHFAWDSGIKAGKAMADEQV